MDKKVEEIPVKKEFILNYRFLLSQGNHYFEVKNQSISFYDLGSNFNEQVFDRMCKEMKRKIFGDK